jgi:hypothetical protein
MASFSRSALFIQVINCRIQKQCNVRFLYHFFQKYNVEDQRVTVGVPVNIVQHDLVDHAAFPGPAIVIAHMRRSAKDPQPYLAGTVAAQNRPVLHQDHFQTCPRRRYRRTGTRQSSAHNHQVRCRNAIVFGSLLCVDSSFIIGQSLKSPFQCPASRNEFEISFIYFRSMSASVVTNPVGLEIVICAVLSNPRNWDRNVLAFAGIKIGEVNACLLSFKSVTLDSVGRKICA